MLVQGVLNDFTKLYSRSSIGLPMQQLKPGGVGGLDLRCGILGVIAATLLTDYANKDISDEYNRIERARASVG